MTEKNVIREIRVCFCSKVAIFFHRNHISLILGTLIHKIINKFTFKNYMQRAKLPAFVKKTLFIFESIVSFNKRRKRNQRIFEVLMKLGMICENICLTFPQKQKQEILM